MRPEESIEKKFATKAKALGINCYKFEVHGKKGAPDRMCILPGGAVMFFEFKRPNGGITSHHQKEFIKELDSFGFDAEVVDSWEYPLEKIKAYLEVYNATTI